MEAEVGGGQGTVSRSTLRETLSVLPDVVKVLLLSSLESRAPMTPVCSYIMPLVWRKGKPTTE